MADPGTGASLSRIQIAARDKRIDLRFLRRVLAIVRPYWLRRGSVLAWLLFVAGFGLSAVQALVQGVLTTTTATQSNALVSRDTSTFWTSSLFIIALMAGSAIVGWISNVAGAYVRIDWRRFLTTHLVSRYLEQRTYYDITIDGDIDNPDQRIQEEVETVCERLFGLPQTLFALSLAVSVQASILAGIAPAMMIALVVFLGVRFVATLFVYRPTIGIAWDIKIAEAELRYGILHVRDNAETIAFYGGEAAEKHQIGGRLAHAIRQMFRKVKIDIFVQSFEVGFRVIQFALPLAFVVPLYFAGQIQFGSIAAATAATTMIELAFGQLANLIPSITYIVPNVVRLAQISEKADMVSRRAQTGASKPGQDTIEVHRGGDDIRLTNVSYITPGGERSLAENVSLMLERGQRLIIVGRTGVGKSSFMRVLAGLLTRGSGRLDAPPLRRTLFMPQRPYMMLGSLRSQLLYPHEERAVDDAVLLGALERARLPDLAARHGGLDARCEWSRILSLGEQQRIGFARFLIHRPDHVFLDEATSAVDVDTEAHLYGLLVAAGVTVVSVAHRTTVIGFHDFVLDLREDGWSFRQQNPLNTCVPETVQ